MSPLRFLFVLVLALSWWQKDTLFDRSATYGGDSAPMLRQLAQGWDNVTPASPAKNWIIARDQWLSAFFEPVQPVGTSSPIVEEIAKSAVVVPPAPSKLSPKPTTTPVVVPVIPEKPIRKILVAGDSMAADIGVSLRQMAFDYKKKTGIQIDIVNYAKHSTGLVVPSYYNWPVELKNFDLKEKPDAVVFLVGANDGQSVRVNNVWIAPGQKGWVDEYQTRVKSLIDAVPTTTKVVWLDLPPIRLKVLHDKTQLINSAVQPILESTPNGIYVQSKPYFGGTVFKEEAAFTSLRAGDGVHYNRKGANLVANDVWLSLKLPHYE